MTPIRRYIANLKKNNRPVESVRFAKRLAEVGYSYGRICQLVTGLENDKHYTHSRALDLWIQFEGGDFTAHGAVGSSHPRTSTDVVVEEEEPKALEEEEIEVIEDENLSLLDWVNITLSIPCVDHDTKVRIVAEMLDSVSVK